VCCQLARLEAKKEAKSGVDKEIAICASEFGGRKVKVAGSVELTKQG
jgi:hypothetical protein